MGQGPYSPDQFNACPGKNVFRAANEEMDRQALEEEQRRTRDLNMAPQQPWSDAEWRTREMGYRAISRATDILAGGEIHPGDVLMPEK